MKNVKNLYTESFNKLRHLPFCQNSRNGVFSHAGFSVIFKRSHEKKHNRLILLTKDMRNRAFPPLFCEQILQMKSSHEKKMRKMLKTLKPFVIIGLSCSSVNNMSGSLKFEKPNRQ
ncbi:MAG TPA: hypothetical protein PLB16_07260 [bacterium]|nr:hypothetical protein [bacterium]